MLCVSGEVSFSNKYTTMLIANPSTPARMIKNHVLPSVAFGCSMMSGISPEAAIKGINTMSARIVL